MFVLSANRRNPVSSRQNHAPDASSQRGYSGNSLGKRSLEPPNPKPSSARAKAIRSCHWTTSLLKHLAAGYARKCGPLQASAGPLDARLPPQPPQDQRRGPNRGTRHQAARGARAVDHGLADRRHALLPLVPSKPRTARANGIGMDPGRAPIRLRTNIAGRRCHSIVKLRSLSSGDLMTVGEGHRGMSRCSQELGARP